MSKIFWIISACVVVAVLGAGAWWYFGSRAPATDAQAAAVPVGVAIDVTGASSATSSRPAPAQCGQSPGAICIEYRNEQYHFSVFVSDQRDIKVYDEGGGAETITFENLNTVHGFQIFIVPYAGTQVSEARFKEDEPSGVRTDVQNITVGGATAAAFYSTDINLGDTYEVWFIHDGYLYELTSLKARASAMQERLQTWEFI